jgi:hypothetical protein
MIRIVFTVLVPLLLPTALYVLWLLAMRRLEATGVGAMLRALPWPWLGAAGVVLVALVLGVVTLRIGGGTAGTYVPPHTVDGKIVPGHVEPAPQH